VAVGLGCVAVVVIALWILSGYAGSHRSATSGDTQVSATVRTTAACQGTDNHDVISFVRDGATHLAKLNGCGHQPGEVIDVLVPAAFDGNTVMELAAAAPGNSSGLSHRVAFLLLVLATAVGGGCGYQIFRIRNGGGLSGRSIKVIGPPVRPDRSGPRFGLPESRTDSRTESRAESRISVDRTKSGRRDRSARSDRPGRLAARFRSSSADRDEVFPGESRRSARDPEATGVDWFEDSSANLHPIDLGDRAE
jgi:hypothetical protein